MTGQHKWHVMGECQDLSVGFVGIRLEKSVSVMECDSGSLRHPEYSLVDLAESLETSSYLVEQGMGQLNNESELRRVV